jgi:hypothetical protein
MLGTTAFSRTSGLGVFSAGGGSRESLSEDMLGDNGGIRRIEGSSNWRRQQIEGWRWSQELRVLAVATFASWVRAPAIACSKLRSIAKSRCASYRNFELYIPPPHRSWDHLLFWGMKLELLATALDLVTTGTPSVWCLDLRRVSETPCLRSTTNPHHVATGLPCSQ